MVSLGGRDSLENRIAEMIGREFGRMAIEMETWLVSQGVTDGVRLRLPMAQWDDFTEVFGRNIQEELEDVYRLAVRQFQDEIAFPMTEAELIEAASAWAEDRSRNLVRQLNRTSNNRLNRLLDQYYDNPMTLRELRQRLTNYVFAPSRASASAITEITRASASAQEAIADSLRAEGIEIRTIWQTNNDEMVCFPAWTMIETIEGVRPIQDICEGDIVLTRAGWQPVIATNSKLYNETMRYTQSEGSSVWSTIDHRFYHSEKGWLEIGQMDVGDTVEAINNQVWDINRIFDINFKNTDNMPTSLNKILIFAFISRFILMPIRTIGFKCNSQFWKKEVNGISSNTSFLDIFQADSIQSKPNILLKKCFATIFTVATKATKLSISIGRFFSEFFVTGFAIDVMGWSTAFLATILAIQMFFASESLSTTFAIYIFCIGCATFEATNGISVSDRSINSKFFGTNRANFSGLLRFRVAITGAILLTSQSSRFLKMEGFSTMFTYQWLLSASRLVIAFCRTVKNTTFTLFNAIVRGVKFFVTLSAIYGGHYVSLLLSSFTLLYHKLFGTSVRVYDITVDNQPEFYANGYLVHNCPICGPRHGQAQGSNWFDLPPAHVNCRCFTTHEIVYLSEGSQDE